MPSAKDNKSCYLQLKENIYNLDNISNTPLNVRKLFIGVDFALIIYHIPVNGTKFKLIQWGSKQYIIDNVNGNATPFINILKDNSRYLGGIEELVFIANTCDGNNSLASLSPNELNIEKLRQRNVDITSFPRFRGIYIVTSGINIPTFLRAGSQGKDFLNYIINYNPVKLQEAKIFTSVQEYLINADWYKGKLHPSSVTADRNRGCKVIEALVNNINNRVSSLEEAEKEKKINDSIEKDVAGLKEKHKVMYSDFQKATKATFKLCAILAGNDGKQYTEFLGITPNMTQVISKKVSLYELDGVSLNDSQLYDILPDDSSKSKRDKYKYNIDTMKNASVSFASACYSLLKEFYVVFKEKYPGTVSEMFNIDTCPCWGELGGSANVSDMKKLKTLIRFTVKYISANPTKYEDLVDNIALYHSVIREGGSK